MKTKHDKDKCNFNYWLRLSDTVNQVLGIRMKLENLSEMEEREGKFLHVRITCKKSYETISQI